MSTILGQLLAFLAFGLGGSLPLGIPPAPPDPVIQQAAPAECLFYLSKAGVAAADHNSKNQTELLLAEPEVKQLLSEAERLITTAIQKNAARQGHDAGTAAVDAIAAVKILLLRPMALYVTSVQPGPPPDVRGGLIVGLGDQAEKFRTLVDKYWLMLVNGHPDEAKSTAVGGQKWSRLQPAPDAPMFLWTFKGDYLLVAIGEAEAEALWKRIGGPVSQWLTTLQSQLAVPRTATLAYLNAKKLVSDLAPLAGPQVPGMVETLGLSNVTSIGSVNGLDGTGSIGCTLIALDGEPAGLLSLLATKPLSVADVQPIPVDATIALAFRLNVETAMKTVVSIFDKFQPGVQQQADTALDQIGATTGIDLRAEFIGALGDTWRIYNSPGEGGLVVTGLTAVVSVKDRAKLAASLDKLRAVGQLLASQQASRGGPAPRIEKTEFLGQAIYRVDPGQRDFFLAPSWCLTDKELIVSLFPQNIKAYLGRDKGYRSLAQQAGVALALKEAQGPAMLSYQNTPELVRLLYPLLQIGMLGAAEGLRRQGIDIDPALLPSAAAILRHLGPSLGDVRRTKDGILLEQRQTLPAGCMSAAPVLLGLLLPAVHSARESARRVQSMNNLKQISLALLNYESANNKLPAAYSTDKAGQPLLSWRVAILPYIEEVTLYNQFHRDEPWDSPHNKALIAQMPAIYRATGSQLPPTSGRTNYLTVRGKDTAFPGKDAIRLPEITDGMSNTIGIVEVNDAAAVVWTRPDDFEPDPQQPVKGLTGLYPGGFNAAFLDGSVRLMRQSIDPSTLKALFTRNGGEVIDAGKF